MSAHLFIALFTVLFVASPTHAQTPEYGSATLQAGSMTLTISRGGEIAPQIQGAADGLLWPGAPALVPHQNTEMRRLLFSATPVLVGSVRGEVRASASYYRDNSLPGPVLPGLRSVNPRDPRYRAFTIRIGDETAPDFQDWPIDLGAPVDSTFEPLFYGSPQMFWVMNDLDTAKMRANMGSDPMGLELRCLAFPLSSLSALGDDATLLQITWINQSPDSIRDAYAGFFADVDVRDGFRERAGSDSVRGLVYVYHDDALISGEEGMPAAFGISMLQTPAVSSPSDSARWSNGMKIGYRNLPVTSGITPLKSVPSPVAEPELGEGGEAWLALMKGEGRGTTVLNPRTSTPTGFWFSGDPVGEEGWQMEDGFLFENGETAPFGPRDQRVMISSGPFDLAPGDTQQVVIAMIAARGATGKAAAYLLRDQADFLRQYWQRRNAISGFATASVRHDPEAGGGTSLRFTARSSIAAEGVEADVTAPDGATLTRFPLMALQQGTNTLYTGSVTLPAAVEGVNAGFIVRDGGETHRLPGRVSIPRAGAIEGRGAEILQEYDGNGRIAPDDNALWIPRLYNSTDHAVDLRIEHPSLDYLQWMQIPGLPAHTAGPSDAWPWQPSFGSRGVPAITEGWGTDFDSTFFEYDLYETGTNSWWQIRNWVQVDSTAGEWYDALMTRVRSGSEQLPGVIIRDLDQLQDKWYVARITEGTGTRMLSLYDSATGGLIFSDYALDSFNGQTPVTEGFRVVRGTIGARYTGYSFENVEGLQPSGFGMYAGRAGENNFEEAERRDFRLEFTLDGLQYWHYAERGYEGKLRLPLRAFYREDDGSWTPAQAALHETGSDIPDGDPNPDGGDYIMLYQTPYNADAEPETLFLPESTLDFPAPLLLQLSIMPTTGSMEIAYPIPVAPGDVFSFNPRHFLMAKSNKAPAAATLHPPAPMPFSAWTSALLELQQLGSLRVEVYNSLGQRVRVLFDGMRDAGKHLLVWDGYWGDGRPAESGLYLLRAATGGREITRKLMLVR